jgi:hypothetical protein
MHLWMVTKFGRKLSQNDDKLIKNLSVTAEWPMCFSENRVTVLSRSQ